MKRTITFIAAILLFVSGCNAETKQQYSRKELAKKPLRELVALCRDDFDIGVHLSDKIFKDTDKDRIQKALDINAREYGMGSVGVYMGSNQPDDKSFRFIAGDRWMKFAKENNMKTYLHPLFGTNQYQAKWLTTIVREKSMSNEEVLAICEERIKAVFSRYDNLDVIDVYNEALDQFNDTTDIWRLNTMNMLLRGGGMRSNEYGTWPYNLEMLFRMSRKYADKDTKLIFTDNRSMGYNSYEANICINLMKSFRKEGIPIDGIGIQFHAHIDPDGIVYYAPTPKTPNDVRFYEEDFAKCLKEFEKAGIDVYITEFDVHLLCEKTDEVIEKQAQVYAQALRACLNAPNCKLFKSWGLADRYCWIPRPTVKRDITPYPLPFDDDVNPKPAYFAMKEVLIDYILNNKK